MTSYEMKISRTVMVYTTEWEVGSGIKEKFDVDPIADGERIGLQTKRCALSIV